MLSNNCLDFKTILYRIPDSITPDGSLYENTLYLCSFIDNDISFIEVHFYTKENCLFIEFLSNKDLSEFAIETNTNDFGDIYRIVEKHEIKDKDVKEHLRKVLFFLKSSSAGYRETMEEAYKAALNNF